MRRQQLLAGKGAQTVVHARHEHAAAAAHVDDGAQRQRALRARPRVQAQWRAAPGQGEAGNLIGERSDGCRSMHACITPWEWDGVLRH